MPKEKGSVHIALLVILVLGTLGLIGSSSINTTQKFSDSSQILGESETEKKAAEQAKEASQKAAEQAKESTQKTAEQQKESAKVNIQSKEQKSETEIETSGGQKIKTKVEDDGKTKIEIEQGKKKIKYEMEDGQVKIETEDENEEASGSADEDDIRELRSISKFPLRIDLTTDQLIMTKNGVERVLTVLPAKAVQNMLRAHLKTGLGPKFFGESSSSATPAATFSGEPIATESAEITVLDTQITLEETDGQIAYKIPAKKHLKLFGLIPTTTDFTSFVSAETGVLIKDQQSLLSRILDLLSP